MLLGADLATTTWLLSVLLVVRKAFELGLHRLQRFGVVLPPASDALTEEQVSQLAALSNLLKHFTDRTPTDRTPFQHHVVKSQEWEIPELD